MNSEFELIDLFKNIGSEYYKDNGIIISPGDDCAVFKSNKSTLHVYRLAKQSGYYRWDEYSQIPMTGCFHQVFVNKKTIYLLLCDVRKDGYCFCSRELRNECNKRHYENEKTMDKLYSFDLDSKELVFTGIDTMIMQTKFKKWGTVSTVPDSIFW